MIITSLQNSLIKRVKALHLRKFREAYNEFVVEGKRSVLDTIRTLVPKHILVLEGDATSYSQLLGLFVDSMVVVSQSVMNYVCDTVSNQGIIAVFDIPIARDITSNKILYLDRISDPSNMGTIIRSAAAFGYTDIVASGCVDVFAPKVVRGSMSGLAYVNIIASDVSIVDIKAKGYRVVCADMQGTSVRNMERDSGKVCLVVGSEADGISPEIMRVADSIVAIDMQSVESLNAAVAASILMCML